MEKVFLAYDNLEILDSERFFRDLTKADDGLGIVDEAPRSSDVEQHPIGKLFFNEVDLFDRPTPESKIADLQKSPKILETKIGDSVVIAELDERGAVTRTYLKGST